MKWALMRKTILRIKPLCVLTSVIN